MTQTVESLRRRVARTGFTVDAEIFDLLLLACAACCTQIDGGNKDCPPRVALEDQ